MRRVVPLLLVLAAVLSSAAAYVAVAQGWLSGWQYRDTYAIVSSLSLTNHQLRIVVDTVTLISQGRMRSDCGDIRVTDSDGVTLIPYYVVGDTCGTSSTEVWIRVPSIPAGAKKIYLYYGNPSATRADAPQSVGVWFVREHRFSTTPPVITFSKPSATVLRISSTAASVGQGIAFIVLPRDFLNGKTVRVYWNVYSEYYDGFCAYLYVLNTELHRARALSVTYIHYIYTYQHLTYLCGSAAVNVGWTGWTLSSGTASIGTFTSPYVTLAVVFDDILSGSGGAVDVDYVQIVDSAGNVLFTYHFTESLVMEVTTTNTDYGYLKVLASPEPTVRKVTVRETSALGQGQESVGELVQLFTTAQGSESVVEPVQISSTAPGSEDIAHLLQYSGSSGSELVSQMAETSGSAQASAALVQNPFLAASTQSSESSAVLPSASASARVECALVQNPFLAAGSRASEVLYAPVAASVVRAKEAVVVEFEPPVPDVWYLMTTVSTEVVREPGETVRGNPLLLLALYLLFFVPLVKRYGVGFGTTVASVACLSLSLYLGVLTAASLFLVMAVVGLVLWRRGA